MKLRICPWPRPKIFFRFFFYPVIIKYIFIYYILKYCWMNYSFFYPLRYTCNITIYVHYTEAHEKSTWNISIVVYYFRFQIWIKLSIAITTLTRKLSPNKKIFRYSRHQVWNLIKSIKSIFEFWRTSRIQFYADKRYVRVTQQFYATKW